MDDKLEKFIERAKELGANDAKFIDPATVKTAPWVFLKCKFGCGRFNSRLGCPPHTPTYQETQEVLDCYKTAMLVQFKTWEGVTSAIAKLEIEIFLSGYYKAFGFGSGPCLLCKPCNLKRCAHPNEKRPSMEASGIDVYETVRRNGFPIEVVKNFDCEMNNYGLLLIY